MNNHKANAYILIVVLFLLMQLSYLIVGQYMDKGNYENRASSEFPHFSMDEYDVYSYKLNNYIDDHIPYRNELIEVYSLLNYRLMNASVNDHVIIGKNGWLFLDNKEKNGPIASYMGNDLCTDEELKTIKSNLLRISNKLLKEEVELVILIAPNKERMYSEYLPEKYGDVSKDYATKQIIDYLEMNTDVKIIYLYDELMKYKKDMLLYHKTDTHWNNLSGYISSRKLLEVLGINISNIEELEMVKTESTIADLADMIHLKDKLIGNDCDYELEIDFSNYEYECTDFSFNGEIKFVSNNVDTRRFMMIRDSFGSAMLDYLGPYFTESDFVHYDGYDSFIYNEFNPDILVLEMVERNVKDKLLQLDL